MITAAILKDLAYFYANADRATLEQAGLVSSDTNMMWSGKKAAGRVLDGRTHDEFPRMPT